MKLTDDKLVEILVKQNYLSKEDLEAAQKNSKVDGLVSYLLEQKVLTADLVGQALAESYKLPYFDLNTKKPSNELVLRIPEKTAKALRVVVVAQNENEIMIATDEGEQAEKLTAKLSEFFPKLKLKIVYSLTEDIDDIYSVYKKPLQSRVSDMIKSSASFAPDIVDEIILEAIEYRASDIHFEPQIIDVLLRFRIDGVLHEVGRIPREYYENIINRIKVLARLRIDEHFATQDGAIRLEHDKHKVDLRISIVPIVDGEKIAIRILSDYVNTISLGDLGISQNDQKILENAYKRTYGMILAVGPTGSGKTTSLYSVIKVLHKPEVNITTIEDPVEYKIPGVNQIQVNKERDLTFAKGLKSIVRQDPNIILVGEIRDHETAEIAVNAALTGHLLLSTFHANDAATAIPRLLDMAIEPFLLASTLNLVIAQRLARRICDSCRYSSIHKLSELEQKIDQAEKYFAKEVTLYQGKGCIRCNGSGYRGRIGLYELINITPTIQDLILQHASSQNIWKAAQADGASSFFDDGIEKVKSGIIALDELLRVAPQGIASSNLYNPADAKRTKKSK